MTGRDRLVIIIVAVIAVLGAAYLMVVSPKRKEASTVAGEVSTASSRLASAESKLAEARQAQVRYAAAYASIVTLGKAVPTSEEVPSLIYQLAQATHQKNVDFSSIVSGSSSGTSPSAGSSAGATAAASAGFTQMPFTFVFNGNFFELEHLFKTLTGFTDRTPSGALRVRGRLLTIQSLKLTPAVEAEAHTKAANRILSGTITASAYQLPAGQGVTGGATPSSPAGASTPASSTGAGSATAPAVARVTP